MWFDPFVNHFMLTATALTLEQRHKAPWPTAAEAPTRRPRRTPRAAAKAASRKTTR